MNPAWNKMDTCPDMAVLLYFKAIPPLIPEMVEVGHKDSVFRRPTAWAMIPFPLPRHL